MRAESSVVGAMACWVGESQEPSVIIEDTLSMFKEFISSQTVRKNYYPPDNNLESDCLVFGIEDPIMGR